MVQEYIEIRGARENNLKDVSLRLPKRKITIFTGVSGSGKSSVVFDTIANEAQRLLFENFSMFIRNFLPRYPQPDADAIENLSMAVLVDQKRLGGGSHSTVGTVTDIASVLRLLFSRIGQPYVGSANAFSFNGPQGMCLECNGVYLWLEQKVGIGTWEESPLWRWTFEEHGWSKASLLAQHCSLLPPSCVLHLSCATFPSHKGWIRMSYQGLFS